MVQEVGTGGWQGGATVANAIRDVCISSSAHRSVCCSTAGSKRFIKARRTTRSMPRLFGVIKAVPFFDYSETR
jgi:hypothetical protein